MVLTRDGSPRVAATTSTPARPGSVSLPDGTYSGAFQQRNGPLNYLSVQLKNGSGTGSVMRAGCGSAPISVRVDPSGNVVGDATLFNPSCSTMTKQWSGEFDGSRLVLTIPDQGEFARQEVALSIGAGVPGGSAAAAPGAVQSSPTSTSQPSNTAFDGTYGGGTVPGGSVGGTPRLAASLQVSNGRGSGTLTRPDCSPSQFSVTISPTGNVSGEGYLNCAIGASGVGTYSAGPLKSTAVSKTALFTWNFAPIRGSSRWCCIRAVRCRKHRLLRTDCGEALIAVMQVQALALPTRSSGSISSCACQMVQVVGEAQVRPWTTALALR